MSRNSEVFGWTVIEHGRELSVRYELQKNGNIGRDELHLAFVLILVARVWYLPRLAI